MQTQLRKINKINQQPKTIKLLHVFTFVTQVNSSAFFLHFTCFAVYIYVADGCHDTLSNSWSLSTSSHWRHFSTVTMLLFHKKFLGVI